MEKTTFGFIKNRLFITGLVVGIIFSAVAAILIVSLYQPAPEKQMLKGTMQYWEPSVNDLGIVKWTNNESCENFVGVQFYNDPESKVIICRPEGKAYGEVRVSMIVGGAPCSNINNGMGGIWVIKN